MPKDSRTKKKKRGFELPHTFVILFIIIIAVSILTYIIPAGQFDRVTNPSTGMECVDANSYHRVEQAPVGFFEIFLSIQKGFVDAGSIIFLIFFAYFCIFTVVKTGALHGAINKLMTKVNGREKIIIPLFMIIFGLAGSTYGEMDTVYGLIPIFVGLAIALGYDAMVGLAMTGMAVAIGFASATTNPFTIGIAQSIAGLPIFSGLLFRWVVFIIFMGVGIWWTLRYSKKVKSDYNNSYVKDIDFGTLELDKGELKNADYTIKHRIILIMLFVTIGFIVFGSLKLSWYIDEMSAMFLLSGIIISIFWGFKPNQIADNFIQACSEMVIGAMVVGLSRTILIILQNSQIIDTIIYSLYLPLRNMPKWLAAEGMLIFQNILNLFIPSGSGQATAVMPIMIPLADMLGINRQVAVLAYQFGDGYSNLFWPNGCIAIMASIAKVPLGKWYKFFLPLFGIMFILESALLLIAMFIGYGPF